MVDFFFFTRVCLANRCFTPQLGTAALQLKVSSLRRKAIYILRDHVRTLALDKRYQGKVGGRWFCVGFVNITTTLIKAAIIRPPTLVVFNPRCLSYI